MALLSVQAVAYAGLDALLSVLPLDLCGYLHGGADLGPQLYLRRPTLSDLDSAEALGLLTTLQDLLDDSCDGTTHSRVDVFDAIVAVSSGPKSRGLWIAARRDGVLEAAEAAVVTSLARSIAAVCHLAECAARADE